MEDRTFIGVGSNPDGPDLPLGLGMKLAQDSKAMANFGKMTNIQKESLIDYVRGCDSGEEAENRMEDAVNKLSNGQMKF